MAVYKIIPAILSVKTQTNYVKYKIVHGNEGLSKFSA